jgi:hypothetical protein
MGAGVREVRSLQVAGGDPFRSAGGPRLRELQDRYHHECWTTRSGKSYAMKYCA